MRTLCCFLLLMALALAAIAVFSYPAWLLLHPHFDFPFHRIGARIGMLALLLGFGLLDWSRAAALTAAGLGKLLLLRRLSGLAVACIEETCLRGVMHTGIERESGTTAAVLLTAVLYAATHFFASYHIA